MDGIFISYRRDDTAGYAGRLYDRLAAHFGANRVFMDVEGIEPGTDFVTAIEQAVGSCRVLIVLMGEEWVSLTDKSGRRRLDDPNDFIRLETCAALERNIRVIPVLVEGADMPLASDLPDELRPLTRRQAIEISHKQWEASTGELIRVLEPLLRPTPEPVPPPPPETVTPPEPPKAEPPPAKPEPKPEAKPEPKPEPQPEPKPQLRPEPAHVRPEPGPGPGRKWLLPVAAVVVLGVAIAIWQALKPETAPPGPVATTPTEPAPTPAPAPAPTPAPPAVEPPAPPPRVTASSEALGFGSQPVGARAELSLKLANPGSTAATLGPRRLSGNQANQFALASDTCGTTLPPGGDCRITLAFAPTTPGSHEARLEVPQASGTEPLTVGLAGRATAVVRTEPPAAEAVKPPPVIRAFNARVEGTKATLCYRIENANSASLAPRPGPLARADKACVTLPVREATTFTLSAQGPGGSATSPALEVVPEAAPAIPPVVSPPPQEDRPSPAPAAPGQARVGEIWTYQTRGMWPTSPKRTLQFVVRAVEGGSVTEELRQLKPEGRGTETKSSRGGEGAFLNWVDAGSEFSPYLGTRLKWTGEESWSNIATPDFDSNWRNWFSRAKITGQETVQVPAGSFRAWKVEVWSSRSPTGGRTQAEAEPVRIRYLVWYAPQLARYVRMERKILSAGSTTLEEDIFELVAHRGGS